ncbi:hypothetical protein JNM05_12415 [bacterium]|nr:hypothetical protein [bacterium]
MKLNAWILTILFFSCMESPVPPNHFLTDPPVYPKEHATVQIVSSDIRLRFPEEIELYTKIRNIGPDAAYDVKATMKVYAHDNLVGAIVINFRDGGRIGPAEFDKRTLAMKLDAAWNLTHASDINHGPIVLTWTTRW